MGGAGGVAAASAAAVVVVAEDSMPMAEADTQPGEMQLFCPAAIGCKIGRDLNYVQLLGSAAASCCVCVLSRLCPVSHQTYVLADLTLLLI